MRQAGSKPGHTINHNHQEVSMNTRDYESSDGACRPVIDPELDKVRKAFHGLAKVTRVGGGLVIVIK